MHAFTFDVQLTIRKLGGLKRFFNPQFCGSTIGLKFWSRLDCGSLVSYQIGEGLEQLSSAPRGLSSSKKLKLVDLMDGRLPRCKAKLLTVSGGLSSQLPQPGFCLILAAKAS